MIEYLSHKKTLGSEKQFWVVVGVCQCHFIVTCDSVICYVIANTDIVVNGDVIVQKLLNTNNLLENRSLYWLKSGNVYKIEIQIQPHIYMIVIHIHVYFCE